MHVNVYKEILHWPYSTLKWYNTEITENIGNKGNFFVRLKLLINALQNFTV